MPGNQLDGAASTDSRLPHLAAWVQEYGWVEIGYDDHSRSQARALDVGGIVWEGAQHYDSLTDALRALNAGIEAFMRERGLPLQT